MNAINELYQEIIIGHARSPKNFGQLEACTHFAKGHNPLCGDHVDLQMNISSDAVITDIAFCGDGCAISKASCSLMTECVKGRTVHEAKCLFKEFHDLLTKEDEEGVPSSDNSLGKLNILAGVKNFPMRVKCATLSWHTLNAALQKENNEISTEGGSNV